MTDAEHNKNRIQIAVSSCLLGNKVRYDGHDRHLPYITTALGARFDLIAICPEVAIELGIPRPPIELVGEADFPRALAVDDPSFDVTDRLANYGREQATILAGISGYILKSRSPSCGLAGVPIKRPGGTIQYSSQGIYVRHLLQSLPELPVIEETGLNDTNARDQFIESVLAYHRRQVGQALDDCR